MMNKKTLPEDFILNYSPNQQAELHMWVVDESARTTLRDRLRRVWTRFRRSKIIDYNDLEAEQAWQTMRRKWGDTKPETVIKYLVEKYDGRDHLRKFDYPFLARCIIRSDVKKEILVDMGGGNSYSTVVPMLLQQVGMRILSIDVVNHNTVSKYGVRYVQGDCMNTNLPDETADIVAIISTLEHVGLGRWGDPLDVNGDLRAMEEARRILKPGGHVILTVPYGFPTVVFNLHRIYDSGRFQRLSHGFEVVCTEYTLNGNSSNREEVEEQKATTHIPNYYLDRPENERYPDTPGSLLALLRKI
jgi:SAM-dependent methyltransferase